AAHAVVGDGAQRHHHVTEVQPRGAHLNADLPRRQRVWRIGRQGPGGAGSASGVIVALVADVVVVGTVILWSFFGDALSHRSHSAAARCVGGKESVAVIADPS
ncbi:hypothetical protein H7H80_28720, partial [Mycobacterium interjectum]|nr:hypothetical protein [Mycobacterium interjectum]